MNLERLLGDFFETRVKSSPDVQMPAKSPRPRGWFEEFRAEGFQTVFSPIQKSGSLWSKLSGRVYEVSRFQLSAILALYDANTILWLDDHSDDSDFQTFVHRERLTTWLPEQANDLVDLVVATKLNYLGEPRLVSSSSEIPGFIEADKDSVSIADQIYPATCVHLPEGVFRSSFCVWTRILGKLVKVDCFFGLDHTFDLETVLLAEQIGNFFVPR